MNMEIMANTHDNITANLRLQEGLSLKRRNEIHRETTRVPPSMINGVKNSDDLLVMILIEIGIPGNMLIAVEIVMINRKGVNLLDD